MIYLACPYAHRNEQVRNNRVLAVTKVAAKLVESGLEVFSPLTHNHAILQKINHGEPSRRFWMNFDMQILRICSHLVVLAMPGWEDSQGVSDEIATMRDRGIQPFIIKKWSQLDKAIEDIKRRPTIDQFNGVMMALGARPTYDTDDIPF